MTGPQAIRNIMPYRFGNKQGFTLVEVVIVIVIAGILATVALQSGSQIFETARVEETKQELDALTFAAVGNPELENNGVRSDFGYVGDIGAMPASLDALYSNPGSYTTWNGPYIANRFTQITDDYKKDAWGSDYTYTGGIEIRSTGSGSNIVRKLAGSTSDLLVNQVAGTILDADGSPPGSVYKDSISVRLTIPNGAGTTITRTTIPDIGGYFGFDSIPIGNHDIEIVYQPTDDTVKRFVSVIPNSNLYSEYALAANVWYDTTGGWSPGITHVSGSDSLYADCHGFYFWVENNSGSDISVSSVILTWSPPSAYFRYIIWDGTTVFNRVNPKAESGELVTFSSPQLITDGEILRIDFDDFRISPTGLPSANMDNLSFTVTFSDGSTFDVMTGACP